MKHSSIHLSTADLQTLISRATAGKTGPKVAVRADSESLLLDLSEIDQPLVPKQLTASLNGGLAPSERHVKIRWTLKACDENQERGNLLKMLVGKGKAKFVNVALDKARPRIADRLRTLIESVPELSPALVSVDNETITLDPAKILVGGRELGEFIAIQSLTVPGQSGAAASVGVRAK
jgi:hypothetical protein